MQSNGVRDDALQPRNSTAHRPQAPSSRWWSFASPPKPRRRSDLSSRANTTGSLGRRHSSSTCIEHLKEEIRTGHYRYRRRRTGRSLLGWCTVAGRTPPGRARASHRPIPCRAQSHAELRPCMQFFTDALCLACRSNIIAGLLAYLSKGARIPVDPPCNHAA